MNALAGPLPSDAVRICRGEAGEVFGALAVDGAWELDDDQILSQYLAIHFPHKISALMLEAMKHPGVIELLKCLIGPNVKSMQSMLFLKRAGKPGQAWHQDEYYIPTRDRSLIGVWIALDVDAPRLAQAGGDLSDPSAHGCPLRPYRGSLQLPHERR